MLILRKIFRCERGASSIEYALVGSLIAIAAVGAFYNVGNRMGVVYNNVQNAM